MAPRKRGYEEVEAALKDSPQRELKLPKTDIAAQAAAESNSDASYVSAAAAVFSESEGQDESDTAQSSDNDSDSELSTSSEEPSSEESDDDEEEDNDVSKSQPLNAQEEITNVRPGPKPNIKKEGTDSSLLRRLKSFLPEMHEANEELDREREAGTLDKRNIEACDEKGQHIEMNLGLGVLEEKRAGERSDSEDDMTDDDTKTQGGVMSKLMGKSHRAQTGVQIEEIGED